MFEGSIALNQNKIKEMFIKNFSLNFISLVDKLKSSI